MTYSGWLVLAATFALYAPANAAQPQTRPPIRFHEMDRNNDNVITQSEWTGSAGSFRLHDWNKDGVLSGDEVAAASNGRGRGRAKQLDKDTDKQKDKDAGDFQSPYSEYDYSDWTLEGFRKLDHNSDNRITPDEWHFDRESFRRADHNRDDVISRAEFLSEDGADDDRGDSFRNLDHNNDGRIGTEEWHGSKAVFQALDKNHDGYITRLEMMGEGAPPDLFASLDVDRNGRVSAREWHWSRVAFDRLDTNRDGQLTPEEFHGGPTAAQRGGAFQAGYERGLVEGRAAGREDRDRNQGWDLEGQRELETADSGYEPRHGARTDYQAGYREAFRMAYREGWERR